MSINDSITIRVSTKELYARLGSLEADMRMLKRINYIQFSILLVVLGKLFLF